MMLSKEKYLSIARKVDLNFKDDGKARDLLDSMLSSRDFNVVERLIKDNFVFIFGCGPSLKGDILDLKNSKLLYGAVLVAVDGAVQALLEENIDPDLCVTDLDGDLDSLVEASRRGCVMIVHAHGDNIDRIEEITPILQGTKLGTTQIESTEKIKNFGGFTDGDRAVHLAAHFKARKIFLFGMDYGELVSRYSGKAKQGEAKLVKLKLGKQLLEELAGSTRIPIVNATGSGEVIWNTERVRIKDLKLE